MHSFHQTKTPITTTSTEKRDWFGSKNQGRLFEREQSPNWIDLSHRQYERVLYRAGNQGRKRYEPTIAKRMETKKAEHDAKKRQQPTPITTAPKSKVSTEIAKFDEAVVQEYVAIYGGTPVLTKKFGTRTVVVIFPEMGKTAPRYRDVWQLEDGKEPRKLKASYGNKSSIATLEEMGWKWDILKECCQTLIRHLAGLPPNNELEAAA